MEGKQVFAQWIIAKVLALYITQDDFRNSVDEVVNGYTVEMAGEPMGYFEEVEMKIALASTNIARQLTECYYIDEFETEE